METDKIINNILFKYPLFGNIIVNLEIKYTDKNVCAPAFTDGKTIYYKDEFLIDYDEEEREFIFAHEIFHIVLCHILRNHGKDEDLLNYVEDAIVNQLLIRDGYKPPKGIVYVEDALEYSVDELYMKFLSEIDRIKKWMGANTYHVNLNELGELIQNMMNKLSIYDLQKLMDDNEKMRNDLLEEYKFELKLKAKESQSQKMHFNHGTSSIEFQIGEVGTSDSLLTWENILEENLKAPDNESTSFYEVQMDGIIKKETRFVENFYESEIIVDSSGSVKINIIRIILRECKNILSCSNIKVGFCDTEFYGWNDITSNDDIDNLKVIGRGGTSFDAMADSFSDDVDNKIVITDGLSRFPDSRPDILWVIIGYEKPPFLKDYYCEIFGDFNANNIRYIFIDIQDILNKEESKKLVLGKL